MGLDYSITKPFDNDTITSGQTVRRLVEIGYAERIGLQWKKPNTPGSLAITIYQTTFPEAEHGDIDDTLDAVWKPNTAVVFAVDSTDGDDATGNPEDGKSGASRVLTVNGHGFAFLLIEVVGSVDTVTEFSVAVMLNVEV